jgi:hypothetical protein
MDLLKAMVIAAALTGCVAVVIGSQGSSGGQLAVHAMAIGDYKVFWSWPLFVCGTSLAWALMLLQR